MLTDEVIDARHQFLAVDQSRTEELFVDELTRDGSECDGALPLTRFNHQDPAVISGDLLCRTL